MRPVSLPDDQQLAISAGEFDACDFLALDEALNRLEAYNPRWHQVVLHRYFAGREIDETAELLNTSATTVKSDWQLARAGLRRELEGSAD